MLYNLLHCCRNLESNLVIYRFVQLHQNLPQYFRRNHVADSILDFFGLSRRNHVADVFGVFCQNHVADLYIF